MQTADCQGIRMISLSWYNVVYDENSSHDVDASYTCDVPLLKSGRADRRLPGNLFYPQPS